ncbi:hypothetical protein [Flavobacterium oreochromis]|uniref:PBCV-specific basic adaptor domain-containing protein n=1 Tax=Flavobacterium columnare TaxID=996 RepID=A0A246G867_9FLAO|nr:hypothetical protein [Flavobacterium oreochromis]OWP74982.1 hypothetical protein BWK62_13045 [Flavobacterium oreochromis]OWP75030.1 hypothetical protein BWG23_12205 [Flavobacterium oreochromis]
MKKIIMLSLMFVLSNTFAQEVETKIKKSSKTKAVSEKLEKVKETAKVEREKAKAEKEAAKAEKEAAKAEKEAAKAEKEAAKAEKESKIAAKAKKLDAKVKDEADKAKSKAKKAKEELEAKSLKPAKKERVTTEKATLNTKDQVVGKYKDRQVYQGPRGGKYYINKNGNKTYIDDEQLK